MQVHLTFLFFSFFNLHLTHLYLVPEGEWPLSPLGNNLLLKSELVHIHEWRVYFSRPLHRPIPFKSGWGMAQVLDSTALVHYDVEPQYISLQVLIIFSFSYIIMYVDALCIYAYVSYYISIILACMTFMDIYIYICIMASHASAKNSAT